MMVVVKIRCDPVYVSWPRPHSGSSTWQIQRQDVWDIAVIPWPTMMIRTMELRKRVGFDT